MLSLSVNKLSRQTEEFKIRKRLSFVKYSEDKNLKNKTVLSESFIYF